MDATLKKLCGLLESPDNMRRCAGAIALAELAPKQVGVVKVLGEALENANQTLTVHILEAFEAISLPAAVPYVMPLLDAEELEIKLRAAALVSKGGGAVVSDITSRIGNAPRRVKLVLVDVLARIHTREAFRALLDLLFEPDMDIVRDVCDGVRRYTADASPKERASLHKQVADFMKMARVKPVERVTASCLLLLGAIGKPEARTILLKHAGPKFSPYLRRHALLGLRSLKLSGAAAAAVSKQLLGMLDETDEGLVRLAAEILWRVPPSDSSITQWRKLLANRHAVVRAGAARQLAADDKMVNNRELLSLLGHEDTDVQELAAGALAAHKKAAPLLLDALKREKDEEAAWRLAKILKPHGEAVDKKALKPFGTLAGHELTAGNPRAKALLYFVRNIDQQAADTVLRDTGLAHRRAKRWAPAVDCLRRLMHTDSFDDETFYTLSVCDLKLSPKEIAPQLRAEDHALRGFHALLRGRAFKLLERLKKDNSLDAEDLYYVGFHFSDAPGDEKEFGEQVLAHVAKTWPRSKEGKAARSKLKVALPPRKKRAKAATKRPAKPTKKRPAKAAAKRQAKSKRQS